MVLTIFAYAVGSSWHMQVLENSIKSQYFVTLVRQCSRKRINPTKLWFNIIFRQFALLYVLSTADP